MTKENCTKRNTRLQRRKVNEQEEEQEALKLERKKSRFREASPVLLSKQASKISTDKAAFKKALKEKRGSIFERNKSLTNNGQTKGMKKSIKISKHGNDGHKW